MKMRKVSVTASGSSVQSSAFSSRGASLSTKRQSTNLASFARSTRTLSTSVNQNQTRSNRNNAVSKSQWQTRSNYNNNNRSGNNKSNSNYQSGVFLQFQGLSSLNEISVEQSKSFGGQSVLGTSMIGLLLALGVFSMQGANAEEDDTNKKTSKEQDVGKEQDPNADKKKNIHDKQRAQKLGDKDGKKEDEKTNLLPDAVQEFKALLGDRFKLSSSFRSAYAKDFSYHEGHDPEAVCLPNTEDEVADIVSICNKYDIPIVPYGSGTSLEGHTIPESGVDAKGRRYPITVSFANMAQVIKVNADDFDCVVQPGITYERLNEHLKQYGLWFPMDPGPGASIGGMVGTSCSGTNAVRYGTMKDSVKSLRVVLPDGTIIKTGNRAKKSSAGYDLTHLFIGAEGTFGLVTQVTLRLQRIPETSSIAVCPFDSIDDATKSVIETMQAGVRIGRVELLDDVMMKAVNLGAGLSYPEKPHLFFEFSGSKAEVHDQTTMVEKITSKHNAGKFQWATDPEERATLWKARKEALWSAPSLQEGSEVLITDVCVPISSLSQAIHETKKDIEESKFIAPLVGHAGDGNFHLFLLLDSSNKNDVARAHAFNDRLVKRAIALDGTCTGEHGVGLGKMEYLPLELGEGAVGLMRTLKHAIDPKNLLNPGKIVSWDAKPRNTTVIKSDRKKEANAREPKEDKDRIIAKDEAK